jgi:hypothetical protein
MRRGDVGHTIVELTLSATILVGVLTGAHMMVSSSGGLASSSANQGVASNRVSRSLHVMTDALRRGSLASARHLDGSNFADGDVEAGFQIREVEAYRGGPVLGSLTSYRLDAGQVIRSENGVEEVLANGVTALSVTRTGNIFIISISARSGPTDDRGRVAVASEQALARNP